MPPAPPPVHVFTTAAATPGQLREIRVLLDAAFDGTFSDDDWAHALGGWHAVAVASGAVVAHAAVVARTLEIATATVHAGYVEGVGTVPSQRRRGLATL